VPIQVEVGCSMDFLTWGVGTNNFPKLEHGKPKIPNPKTLGWHSTILAKGSGTLLVNITND